MHLANARQRASEIIKKAEEDAVVIKETAIAFTVEQKALVEKAKIKTASLKEKEDLLNKQEKSLDTLKQTLEESIAEHRKLTADRSEEQEAAKKVRIEFEGKLKKLRELAAS